MGQRSPYNDRYKVEQKGKTRKSASAAKPKRAVADLTPGDSPKKGQKKKSSVWSRAKSASNSGNAATQASVEGTPRMKELRRIWWVLWAGALLVAVGILLLQQNAVTKSSPFIPIAWVVWLGAMGGAFYLEFGPIRKERARAIEAAKAGGKPSKKEKTTAAAPDDRQPPSQDGDA